MILALLMSLCELVRHDRAFRCLKIRAAELNRFFVENIVVTLSSLVGYI